MDRVHTAPQLFDRFGIGVDTVCEILIVDGGNPNRFYSDAAFAKLAGAIHPVPTGSGMSSFRRRF